MTTDVCVGPAAAARTTAPAISVTVDHQIIGATRSMSYLTLLAAVSLAEHCTHPDQCPAVWAVEENALTNGWQLIPGEFSTGVSFEPEELNDVIWLARALILLRDAREPAPDP